MGNNSNKQTDTNNIWETTVTDRPIKATWETTVTDRPIKTTQGTTI